MKIGCNWNSFSRLALIHFYFFFSIVFTNAQQNSFTIEGGYARQSSNDFQGWKINGLYEYHPKAGKFLYGGSVGYVRTSDRETVSSGGVNYNYAVSTIPIVVSPKYLMGNGSLQGFVKMDVGYQFSSRKNLNSAADPTNESGFYGGFGAGILKSFGPKYFIQFGYELVYLESTFYNVGLEAMQCIIIGIGSRFE